MRTLLCGPTSCPQGDGEILSLHVPRRTAGSTLARAASPTARASTGDTEEAALGFHAEPLRQRTHLAEKLPSKNTRVKARNASLGKREAHSRWRGRDKGSGLSSGAGLQHQTDHFSSCPLVSYKPLPQFPCVQSRLCRRPTEGAKDTTAQEVPGSGPVHGKQATRSHS